MQENNNEDTKVHCFHFFIVWKSYMIFPSCLDINVQKQKQSCKCLCHFFEGGGVRMDTLKKHTKHQNPVHVQGHIRMSKPTYNIQKNRTC